MNSFSEYLRQENEKRNWNQADLARACNFDSAVISNIVNGRRGPGIETCRAIARAYGYSDVTVLRAAGLLDPLSPTDYSYDEWQLILSQLTPDEQDELIEIARLLLERRRRRHPAQQSKPKREGTAPLELVKEDK